MAAACFLLALLLAPASVAGTCSPDQDTCQSCIESQESAVWSHSSCNFCPSTGECASWVNVFASCNQSWSKSLNDCGNLLTVYRMHGLNCPQLVDSNAADVGGLSFFLSEGTTHLPRSYVITRLEVEVDLDFTGYSMCDRPDFHKCEANCIPDQLDGYVYSVDEKKVGKRRVLYVSSLWGHWYSFLKAGQCAWEQTVGDGCSWKQIKRRQEVSLQCLSDQYGLQIEDGRSQSRAEIRDILEHAFSDDGKCGGPREGLSIEKEGSFTTTTTLVTAGVLVALATVAVFVVRGRGQRGREDDSAESGYPGADANYHQMKDTNSAGITN